MCVRSSHCSPDGAKLAERNPGFSPEPLIPAFGLHPGYKLGTLSLMAIYNFTEYFEKEVLRKRPYLKKEWCIRVLENPIRSEPQEQNRFRFWAEIPELDGRFLRVVTLEDKLTIHNAFPDRRFKP